MGPEDYARWLEETAPESTAEVYCIAAKRFETWLAEKGLTRATAPREALSGFALALAPTMSPSSVAVYARGVKRYFAFLAQQGEVLPQLTPPRVPRDLRDYAALTDAELNAYALHVAACAEPYRTALLLASVVAVPLRELIHLDAGALVTGRTAWFVLPPLRRSARPVEHRRVPITPAALAVLVRYLRRVRPGLGSSPFLFPSPGRRPAPIALRSLTMELAKLLQTTGRHVTPKALYRSALQHLARAGVDGFELAEIAGTHDRDVTRTLVRYNPDALYRVAARAEAPWLKGLS